MTMNAQPTILYVEDDHFSRHIMQLMLVKIMKLPQVTIFEDSTNFLERVTALQPKPDLIFLDIHVPPLDGFMMLELLRSVDAFRHTPVLALTASVMNEEVRRLKSAGFNGVIAKPIDQDTFPSVMQRIVMGEQIWRVIDA